MRLKSSSFFSVQRKKNVLHVRDTIKRERYLEISKFIKRVIERVGQHKTWR